MKKPLLFALSLAALAGSGFVYARWIEPEWLVVTEHRETVAGLETPLRLAVVGDLHAERFGPFEQRVLDAIDNAQVDAVLVVGDLVTPSGLTEAANRFLGALDAPLGVFWVPGNHEHWALEGPPEAFFNRGTPLVNRAHRLRDDVWLVGVDDSLAGEPRPTLALPHTDPSVRIAMLHSPAGVEALAGQVSVAFAGHTHGGQIRLPVLGALVLPPGSSRFDAGWFTVAGTRFFVTVGLGTSIARLRFLCRPEVAVVDLVPDKG
ncbi:MAG: metallophosphoesterase [Myxococcota bacterium]